MSPGKPPSGRRTAAVKQRRRCRCLSISLNFHQRIAYETDIVVRRRAAFDGMLLMSKDDRICGSPLYSELQLFVGWPGSAPISAAVHPPQSQGFAADGGKYESQKRDR